MAKDDKVWFVFLNIIYYLITVAIIGLIHYFLIVVIEYGDQYSTWSIPINIALGILASIIGIDFLIAIPIGIVVCYLIYLYDKRKEGKSIITSK